MSGADAPISVRVTAPGRLHLGFIDLGGALGRRFGSLGITLERPTTTVIVTHADIDSATGPDAARAGEARDKVRAALGVHQAMSVTVDEALPAHGGLGSGTQLALAVGAGVAHLSGHPLGARAIGRMLNRGRRSAIGMEAFDGGGVILDGGRGPGSAAPPLLARLPFPEAWRILLLYDSAHEGLSGEEEAHAMDHLPAFPEALAAHLSHLLLLKALPALAEGEIAPFGAVIGEWQRRLGEHYAAAQGGGRYLSPQVAEAAAFLEDQGISGVGQSSWGPTGFALVGDPARAEELLQSLRQRFASFTNLSFDSVRGRNGGAAIQTIGKAVPDKKEAPHG